MCIYEGYEGKIRHRECFGYLPLEYVFHQGVEQNLPRRVRRCFAQDRDDYQVGADGADVKEAMKMLDP